MSPASPQQSRRTQERICDAAERLFLADGYGGTTIARIAEEADVSAATVYFQFRTKQAIVKHLLDIRVAGDTEPVPTLERPWVEQVLTTRDPVEHIRLHVQGAAVIYERTASVLGVVQRAATVHPEIAELWATNQHQRLTVVRHLVANLAAKATLRPRLDAAVDMTYALLGPELYGLLVIEQGWQPAAWEAWVGDQMVSCLLPPAPHA